MVPVFQWLDFLDVFLSFRCQFGHRGRLFVRVLLALDVFEEPLLDLVALHDAIRIHSGLQTLVVATLLARAAGFLGDGAGAAHFANEVRVAGLLDGAAEKRAATQAGVGAVIQVEVSGVDVANGANGRPVAQFGFFIRRFRVAQWFRGRISWCLL